MDAPEEFETEQGLGEHTIAVRQAIVRMKRREKSWTTG